MSEQEIGVERIARVFQSGHIAFMPYMVLGYPTPEVSLQVAQTLVELGPAFL